jgi:GH24 family phage-related lysozyme (muramidase)
MRTLTPRIVGELLHHEGLVPEAYRDSRGVWTWSVGITDASGHRVERYRENPQPIGRCLEVFVWLLTTRYLPPVMAAFGGFEPEEHHLAAALSFHWNTGAVGRAVWLKRFLTGQNGAREAMLHWRRPPEVLPRRRCERDLFFDARWSGDGTVLLYDVAKPSYRPVNPRRVEVAPLLATMMPFLAVPAAVQAPGAFSSLDSGPCGPRAEPPPAAPTPPNWFDRLFG